jgi:hypothetical protein
MARIGTGPSCFAVLYCASLGYALPAFAVLCQAARSYAMLSKCNALPDCLLSRQAVSTRRLADVGRALADKGAHVIENG